MPLKVVFKVEDINLRIVRVTEFPFAYTGSSIVGNPELKQ